MKLDKFLLFSDVFLALVIACHAMQDIEKSETYDTNIEGHDAIAKVYLKANTKLGILLLFSSAVFALVAYILHYKADNNKPEANDTNTEDHYVTVEAHLKAKEWPKAIATCKIIADAYVSDAIAFLQKNDAASAIEAYKYAATVNNQIALIAQNANRLIDAIETSTFFYSYVVTANVKVAELCEMLADKYRDENDPIGEASALLMAAHAYMDSANWFRSAGDMDKAFAMYKLIAVKYTIAVAAYTMAAIAFRAEKSFDQEAKAWMQVAEVRVLFAWLYRQRDDALNGAHVYTLASSDYMTTAKAFTNAANAKSAIEAYQLAVTQLTTAAQIYHNAQDHENEARQYTEIADLHLNLSEHAQAGAAFELVAHAYQHHQDYDAAIAEFHKAEQAYAVANDPIAVQRVNGIVETVSAERFGAPYT